MHGGCNYTGRGREPRASLAVGHRTRAPLMRAGPPSSVARSPLLRKLEQTNCWEILVFRRVLEVSLTWAWWTVPLY